MAEEEASQPVGQVVALLMVAIAALAWAFCAAAYAHEADGWKSGADREEALLAFASNAVFQIPNVFRVIGFILTKRLWLAGIFLGLECVAVYLGFKMRSLEREFSSPPRRRR
jgi:hypothetical protein